MAADIPSFSKLIPGFDFLENLAKGSGLGVPGMTAAGGAGALPGFSQWVAPTLDPQELGRRIDELKTVQFWLEQNAKLLATTIQALEVQRMTLSTLKTMNVQMGDLAGSMMATVPDALKAKPAAAPVAERVEEKPAEPKPEAAPAADKPAPAVDPMQWWTALTQQFTQLATAALRDAPAEAAKRMAEVDLTKFQVPVPGATPPAAAKKAPARKAAAKKAPAKVPGKTAARKR